MRITNFTLYNALYKGIKVTFKTVLWRCCQVIFFCKEVSSAEQLACC